MSDYRHFFGLKKFICQLIRTKIPFDVLDALEEELAVKLGELHKDVKFDDELYGHDAFKFDPTKFGPSVIESLFAGQLVPPTTRVKDWRPFVGRLAKAIEDTGEWDRFADHMREKNRKEKLKSEIIEEVQDFLRYRFQVCGLTKEDWTENDTDAFYPFEKEWRDESLKRKKAASSKNNNKSEKKVKTTTTTYL